MPGSWAVVDNKPVVTGGHKSRIIIEEAEFVADAADGSIPTLVVGSEFSTGLLQRVSIVFGDPPPAGASLMLQVADANGLVLANQAADKIAASTDVTVNKIFGGALSVQVTGNTTLSAEGKVVLYVVN